MTQTISLLTRLIDTLAPRSCMICSERLTITEEVMCTCCNHCLPRMGYSKSSYDNKLVRFFWGKIPIEKDTAFFFCKARSDTSRPFYQLKYSSHPEIGERPGHIVAAEFAQDGFFDGITAIALVPLARRRERGRGYNQNMEIVRSVSAKAGLPILDKVLERTSFHGNQTQEGCWGRDENIGKASHLSDVSPLSNQYVLLVDDIITPSATPVAAAKELLKGTDVKISVLLLSFMNSN